VPEIEARSDAQQLEQENARLQARVTELENELVELQARTNEVVAGWQERAYWLERWHLDLNALMRKPGASEFRGALRAIRSVARFLIRIKRRLTGS
jgi:hypothetical protein